MDPKDIFDKDFGNAQGEQYQYDENNKTIPELEQELTNKYHFKGMDDTKELYYYDEGSRDVSDIKNRIIWTNYMDRTEFDHDIEWLCCKNVMVNLKTGEVKPHSPEFMTTVQIPHDFIISKAPFLHPPKKIMEFLHQVMTYDDVETVLDFMAYCLWREFPFHRWLLLNGSGRNGKGTTTRLITKLLGRENISNETLHRILEHRFASAKLYGKMANIDADMSKEELKRTGMLKMLTGDDDIPAEFKFKNPFSFRNYAKLIFSANTMPVTPDETDAFFARLIIINFPHQFLGDKVKPNLLAEITTEAEMSALLSMLIRRLPRVLKTGIYTPHSSIEENYIKYMESSNPIKLFAETAIHRATEGYETKADVFSSYTKFCDEKRLGKESSATFSRRLLSFGFEHMPKKINGVKTHVWVNVKLIDYTKVDDDQETLT